MLVCNVPFHQKCGDCVTSVISALLASLDIVPRRDIVSKRWLGLRRCFMICEHFMWFTIRMNFPGQHNSLLVLTFKLAIYAWSRYNITSLLNHTFIMANHLLKKVHLVQNITNSKKLYNVHSSMQSQETLFPGAVD